MHADDDAVAPLSSRRSAPAAPAARRRRRRDVGALAGHQPVKIVFAWSSMLFCSDEMSRRSGACR